MRRENGSGTVSLIDKKSKRRKPYVVKITTGWDIDMETQKVKPIRKTLGYVRTRKEGNIMLAEYFQRPYDLDNNNITFSSLYDKWFDYKKGTGLVESSYKRYIYARKHFNDIEMKTFKDITRDDLQRIVNSLTGKAETQKRVIHLYKQMHNFARGNNIPVGADVSLYVNVEKVQQSTLHKPFTNEEIDILWNNRDEIIDVILINIYTGCRPGELLKISEVHDDYFITGSKTDSGMNRVIPLNHKIKDIFHNTYNNHIFDKFDSQDIMYHYYKRHLNKLNLNHSPYDCRHTFATLMDKAKASDHCIKLIMGHKIEDITKRVYTHKVIEELIEAVNLI